jgi:hypothetical protein
LELPVVHADTLVYVLRLVIAALKLLITVLRG